MATTTTAPVPAEERPRVSALGSAAAQAEKSFEADTNTAAALSATAPGSATINEVSAQRPLDEATAPAREVATESLRKVVLDAHRRDPLNSAAALDNPASRGVFQQERETIERMSRPQLETYQAAREHGPMKAEAAMKAASRDVQADVETSLTRTPIPPLEDRFNVITRGLANREYEFRDQPGKIAFRETFLKLQTQTDSPAAAKAMVDRAAERGWETVRIGGSGEFIRQAWIAATAQGIKAVGHTPTAGDRQASEKEKARVDLNRALADAPARQKSESSRAQRGSVERSEPQRENARRSTATRDRQLVSAFDKALRDGNVPASLRDRLRERMAAESARRSGQGERFNVRVYDPKAPRAKPKTINVGAHRIADRERLR